MRAHAGKYFSGLIAVDSDGQELPHLHHSRAPVGAAAGGGAAAAARAGLVVVPPHTFAYRPNAHLAQFYAVERYTTDDSISSEKRKARGLATD